MKNSNLEEELKRINNLIESGELDSNQLTVAQARQEELQEELVKLEKEERIKEIDKLISNKKKEIFDYKCRIDFLNKIINIFQEEKKELITV